MPSKSTKEDNVVVMPNRASDDLVGRVARALEGIERPIDVFSSTKANVGQSEERIEDCQDSVSEPKRFKDSKQMLRTAPDLTQGSAIQYIPVESIELSPYQTREVAEEDALLGLVQSIKNKGIIQPLLVRAIEGEQGASHELIAGERRLLAAKRAGLTEVPCLVRDINDQESLELSIIENAQREDLNPIEEALALKMLVDDFKLNQTELSRLIGKSRVSVSNSLRLLMLSSNAIDLLKSGELSAGHGRALLMIDDPKLQSRLADRAVKQALSVRGLEELVSRIRDATGEEEEEISEEDIKRLASLERLRTRVANLLELDCLDLKIDSQGRKRLNLVFETEASWKRFMARIRD